MNPDLGSFEDVLVAGVLVRILETPPAPIRAIHTDALTGLFYGGGMKALEAQFICSFSI